MTTVMRKWSLFFPIFFFFLLFWRATWAVSERIRCSVVSKNTWRNAFPSILNWSLFTLASRRSSRLHHTVLKVFLWLVSSGLRVVLGDLGSSKIILGKRTSIVLVPCSPIVWLSWLFFSQQLSILPKPFFFPGSIVLHHLQHLQMKEFFVLCAF